MKKFLTTILLSFSMMGGVFAQSAVNVGAQVTSENAIESGKGYILQQQANGTPYIADAGTYYSVPNSGSTSTEACIYEFISNGDGTWKIKSKYTGKYWGVPVYDQAIEPVDEAAAGKWTLTFNTDGTVSPTAPDAEGETRAIDRSSQKLVAYTVRGKSENNIKIFQVGGKGLSNDPLKEFDNKLISVASQYANNLTTGQWYVMFDRGAKEKPHGYLYENVSSHTLYNTKNVPAGLASSNAQFLVRLSNAGDGKYYVQTGYGNYFGKIEHKTNVPVTAMEEEAIIIAKIANTNGHFYLQSSSTNVVLDANDVASGDATVVGWNTVVPTAIDGNNDWAFYPVSVEDISDDIALFAENVTVTRGYQTCGRGNANSLMLRIDMEPFQNMTDATITVKLNDAAKNNISSLYIYETTATKLEFIANIPSAPLGSTDEIGTTASINIGSVTKGKHYFWLCATVKDDAELEKILEASLTGIDYTRNGTSQSLNVASVGKPSRQGMKVFDQQNFVFKPTSDNCRYYRIPAMVLDKDGNLVVAVDKRYNSNADLGNHKIDVASKRSTDGGRTWTNAVTIARGDGSTEAKYGYGDPSLVRTPSGKIICLMAAGSKGFGSGQNHIGMVTSTNNGQTWTQVVDITTRSGKWSNNSGMTDFFVTSGKGLCTNDGVLMFLIDADRSYEKNYLLYSTDEGESWTIDNNLVYSAANEAKLVQLNDGSLLASVRQSGNRGWNTATYEKNADGTVTFNWGKQYRTGDIWGNSCNADILYYSRKTDGKEDIMLHSYINSSGRESLQLAMSLDGGKSWKSVYNIQPNGSCYSTMIQLPNGNVALLYEDESYSAGNGYAINYVTITKEQILDWYQKNGGIVTDIEEGIRLETAADDAIYDLQGRRMTQSGKLPKGIYVQQGRKFVVK